MSNDDDISLSKLARWRRSAWRALKLGGILITYEPGAGQSKNPTSLEAMRLYGTNEKDMPPARVFELGRRAGFRKFERFIDPTTALTISLGINVATTSRRPEPLWKRVARAVLATVAGARRGAICVLHK